MKKMSKLFTLSATSVLVGAAFVGVASADQQFSDVKPSSSHYDSINTLAELGLINGFEDGTFRPNTNVTRGQAAKMIVSAFNLGDVNPKNPNFTDVPANNEYLPYIATLKSLGIVQGYSDGTYGVSNPITRAQMAKMISLALNLTSTNTHPFTDTYPDALTNQYIANLYNHKITNGTSATTFSPTKSVTRGQLASFITRAMPLSNNQFTLSILHTNDVHSHVEAYPKLYSAIKDQHSIRSNTLLLDAGDITTGTLYFNEFSGEAEMTFMNALGYDAATFGNHEFDLGSSPEGHTALKNLVANAKFPFVTANVDFSADSLFDALYENSITTSPIAGKIRAGFVQTIGTENVGVFGLTTAETKDISSPGSVTFKNYITSAQNVVNQFESMNVDKIVVLSHLGFDDAETVDNDQMLAKYVDGIDIIVGSHSHTQLDAPVIVDKNATGVAKDPTIIVQAYQYGDFLGTLDVQFDKTGVVTNYRGSLVKVADYEATQDMLDILAPFAQKISETSNKEIGVTLSNELPNPRVSDANNTTGISVRNSETILGNIITDGMKSKAQNYSSEPVIMSVQNGGGIRSSINAGPITVGEVITVLPFGNTLALVHLSGAEIKQMFETSLRNAPSENGGFLHVSGAKLVYDSSKPVNERVVSIEYTNSNGEYVALDDNTTYVIATNAFTAKGGDGFEILAKAYSEGRVTDLGLSDWENFRDHLQSLTTIPTELEGRIIDSAAK